MRNAFAKEITKIGKVNKKLVLLTGDIGNRLFDNFKANKESNFINCGIAEANMMGVAAGLAMSGLKPVIYTITPFTTTRCFEQIRVDACYHNVPLIIVGTGSGLSYASLGPTHHSLEDFAIFRSLPNITILAPADAVELRECLKNALKLDSPVYIRIGKKGEEIVTNNSIKLEIGKSINHRTGKDICLISTGTILPEVLKASEFLESEGFSCRVESFHSIKPLDTKTLKKIFSTVRVVSTIEEHSKIGGLFGAISEWRSHSNNERINSVRMLSFGTEDEFMHEVGSQNYARRKYGLYAENIFKKTLKAFKENKKD